MPEIERLAGLARRPELPSDEAFLRQLFQETRGDILAGLDPALVALLLRQQYAGQAMTYRTNFPAARFEIVEHEGSAVGRIVVDEAVDAIRLVDIALLAAWRGRGVGTQLLRDLLDRASAAGLPVDLGVALDNARARRLYDRLGFTLVAITETEIALRWRPPINPPDTLSNDS